MTATITKKENKNLQRIEALETATAEGDWEFIKLSFKPTLNPKKKKIDERKFKAFARWFYYDYMDYKDADFHKEIYKDLTYLQSLDINELSLIGARDTAKTSIVKIWVVYAVLYRLFNFGVVVSFDKNKAIDFVSDVYEMINSPEIMAVYGNQFYREKNSKVKAQEKMSAFDTTTLPRVSLVAVSAMKSLRGQLKGKHRPDLYIGDDFENVDTLASLLNKTPKIWEYRKEAMGSLNLSKKKVINLANYISEAGNVHKIIKSNPSVVDFITGRIKDDDTVNKKHKLLLIPIMDDDGNILWKDRFTKTDEEAVEINKTREMDNKVVSMESLERDNPESYQSDYLVKPSKFGDLEFIKKKVEAVYKEKKVLRYVENIYTADPLKIYEEYEEGGFYGVGADTSEGKGKDSNTAVIIRFDVSPFRVVATYKSSTIDPDDFGDLLAEFHIEYGESAMVAPEINNTGFAVLSTLKRAMDTDYIYQMENVRSEDEEKKIGNLGWRTTASSKIQAISNAKKLIYSLDIEIPDKDLIDELVSYTKQDKTTTKILSTRHFDLFMAFVIALMMKDEEVYSGWGEVSM